MDELSLTARVDKAALTNLSTGFRWASAVSLFFLLMMTFSFRIEDTGIIDSYFDQFFLLAIISSLVFIFGANLLNIPFFYARWKIASIAYASTFSTCWAAIIALISIGGDYYDAADILSDIILMIVLLGFFLLSPRSLCRYTPYTICKYGDQFCFCQKCHNPTNREIYCRLSSD